MLIRKGEVMVVFIGSVLLSGLCIYGTVLIIKQDNKLMDRLFGEEKI